VCINMYLQVNITLSIGGSSSDRPAAWCHLGYTGHRQEQMVLITRYYLCTQEILYFMFFTVAEIFRQGEHIEEKSSNALVLEKDEEVSETDWYLKHHLYLLAWIDNRRAVFLLVLSMYVLKFSQWMWFGSSSKQSQTITVTRSKLHI